MADTTPAPPTGFWNAIWRGLIWFASFFGSGTGVSMKRLTIFMAACTLCYSAIRMTHAVCHQIWYATPLDHGTVTLLSINYGILAVMAGVAYFKRDANGNITIESTKPPSSGATDEPPDTAAVAQS